MRTVEGLLHEQVCDWMRLAYPDLLFRTDFAAGEKLTMPQAIRNKRLQKCKSWPDIFIAKPIGKYGGLFLELKKPGTVLYLKDGSFTKDTHLNAQRKILEELEQQGYRASFAIGMDHVEQLVKGYLKPHSPA